MSLTDEQKKVILKFTEGGCFGPYQFTKQELKIIKKLKKMKFIHRIVDKEVDYFYLTPRGVMWRVIILEE